MNGRQLVALATLLGVAAIGIAWQVKHGGGEESSTPVISEASPLPERPTLTGGTASSQNGKHPPAHTPSSAPSHVSPSRAERASPAELIPKFKARFGSALELKIDSQGCLTSVQGSPQKSAPLSGRFDPADPAQAIARALELIGAAGDLLCLDPASPLADPVMMASPVSVQASFHQTRDGLPVLPMGAVSLTLGPRGELLRLDSTYEPGGTVANEVKLTAAEAHARSAFAFPADLDFAGKAIEGQPIYWVIARTGEGVNPTFAHAYEYHSRGTQIILDAATAQVLFKRDRRIQ